METIDSLVAQYALEDESVEAFIARLHKLLRAKTKGKIDTMHESELEEIPVRDYEMPRLYQPRMRHWPSFRALAIFDDGRVTSATVPSNPDRGVNVGHAIRTLAQFYRCGMAASYGFDDACNAIPVPPIATMTINGRPVADIDECNRILVETVPYDPNAITHGLKWISENVRLASEQQFENMRREADQANDAFDEEQYRNALRENYEFDRAIATKSAAA